MKSKIANPEYHTNNMNLKILILTVMFKGFKKLIIIMGGISLMMILTACDLVKKITNGFKNIENT